MEILIERSIKQEIKYKSNTTVGITCTNSNDKAFRLTQNNFSYNHFSMNEIIQYMQIVLLHWKDNPTLTSKLSLLLSKEEHEENDITTIPFANIDEINEDNINIQCNSCTNTQNNEIYIINEKIIENTNEIAVMNATTKQKVVSYRMLNMYKRVCLCSYLEERKIKIYADTL